MTLLKNLSYKCYMREYIYIDNNPKINFINERCK